MKKMNKFLFIHIVMLELIAFGSEIFNTQQSYNNINNLFFTIRRDSYAR